MSNLVGESVGHAPEFRSVVGDDKWKLPDTHVGIEIEAEHAFNINVDSLTPYWTVKDEGSIRGVSAELVLSLPLAGADLTKALNVLEEFRKNRTMPLSFSERCSDHVHIDVREMPTHALYNFILLYILFERPIFRFCGGNRHKGIYTVPIYQSAEYVKNLSGVDKPDRLKKLLRIDGDRNILKYSAVNCGAIAKFGSIEFRQHPGTDNSDRLSVWINILMCLKKASYEWDQEISTIPVHVSQAGGAKFMEKVFEEYSDHLYYPEIEADILDGVRVVQDVLFSTQMDIIGKDGNVVPESDLFYKYLDKLNIKDF